MRSLALLCCLALLAPDLHAQQPTSPTAPLTLLTRAGRRPLATTMVGGQEMIALDELGTAFQLSVREDTLAGAVTVSYKGKTIVLTPDQTLASVAGRLVSLAAPLTRSGRGWLVPVEFINRALAPVYDTPLELRKASRLVIAGDLRVPRVTVRAEQTAGGLRVTLESVPRSATTLTQETERLLVKFDADALDAAIPSIPAQSVVTAVHGIDIPNVVAIDLGPRFGSFRASSSQPDAGTGRTTVDILGSETETSGLPVPPPPPLAGPAPSPSLPLAGSTGGLRTIVIDPGHGGDETGAKGPSGALEKDVTLNIARRLKAAIEGRLGARVLLTRSEDRTVALDERASIANNNKADLFISLHANGSVRPGLKGAEIFYLSLDKYGDEARRLASSDRQVLPVFGGGDRDIEVILWDMAQARHIEQSATLAGILEQELQGRVDLAAHPLQQAPFRVLVGANMPAVLVEMGYITNPNQERQLGSAAFQTTIVQALLDGVIKFRDALDPSAAAGPSVSPSPPMVTPER